MALIFLPPSILSVQWLTSVFILLHLIDLIQYSLFCETYVFNIQCLYLKCRPQHGGWRWQPLIAQVPAGKSKPFSPLHGGLKLSYIK